MTAYSPIATMQRLVDARMPRPQAEALADELHGVTQTLVTHEQLQAALDRQTVRICGILGTVVIGGFTILAVLISQ